MPTLKLLVEVLHREVAVTLPVKLAHPLKFTLRRTARRDLADPAIAQPLAPVLLIAIAQSSEMAARHAQKLPRLLCVQPPTAILPKRLFKTRHKNLP